MQKSGVVQRRRKEKTVQKVEEKKVEVEEKKQVKKVSREAVKFKFVLFSVLLFVVPLVLFFAVLNLHGTDPATRRSMIPSAAIVSIGGALVVQAIYVILALRE